MNDSHSPFTREFRLDPFQVRARDAIRLDENVLVSVPTGSGKTVVGEFAIEQAAGEGLRCFYTTPIKALSNQKFNDLRTVLGADEVGLLTGDHSINPDAPVVVMTTEVLRNMIYAESPGLADLGWVVLDEVHFIADSYRGPVWEEVLIHAPPQVLFVCLSATISNAVELTDWITSLRGSTTMVVEHERPVALDSVMMVGDRLEDRIDLVPLLVRGRPNSRGSRYDVDRRQQTVGRRRRPRFYTPRRPEVVRQLRHEELLPALYFIFSRKGCDEAAARCVKAGLRLTTAIERDRIDEIVTACTAELDADDMAVLGFDRWNTALRNGIASHHAGLVPPFREAVELCFVEGLTKVVFATETLALGINMPARSVVIEKLSKFDGERHVALTPSTFTQLTGRAGRRGIDDHGHAVVLWSPFNTFRSVAELAASRDFTLDSAFRPNYNMAANLIDRYDRRAAFDVLSRSFAQFQLDRSRTTTAKGQQLRGGLGRRGERLELTDEFEAIIEILETYDHARGWSLTDAGRRLRRVFHQSDLLISLAIEHGLFDDLDPAELAAMVSAITYEHRSKEPPGDPVFPTALLRERFGELHRMWRDLSAMEHRLAVMVTAEPQGGFMSSAWAWTDGNELSLIIDEDLTGGDFVRNIRQVIDLAEQLGEISPNPTTARNARRAGEAIRRGVVAAAGGTA